jgi:DNA-binding Xre family transcriptional regulator
MKEKWKILILLLREIAREKNITLDELYQKTRIEQSNLSHIFNLDHGIGIKRLFKITDALDLNITLSTKDGEKFDWGKLKSEARKNYK